MTAQTKRTALQAHEDPRMHRLWNPQTRRYLHLSATCETDDINLSWLGYQHQADTLRERARIRGDDWPYVRRSRNVAQVAVPTFDQVEGMV